jgi:pimeloyl-ACP methyl ester carboxylesterase
MAGMTIVKTEERVAPVGSVELCFDTFGDPADQPLLLIMGLASQMVLWEDDFCALLAEQGRWVIRFDNRDVGRSTILRSAGVPSRIQLLRRDPRAAAYTLEQMADDAAGLLDHLRIERAEIVGASMGGMIAQALAIHHPDRVSSLVSIMSTTGNRRVGRPHPQLVPQLFRRRARTKAEYLADFARTWNTIASPVYRPDPVRIQALAELCFTRGVHPSGAARQLAAIMTCVDRTPALRTLRVPTTVIHGDRDRLVTPSGGRATAAAIPGARLEIIPGMAHHLPEELWPRMIELITTVAG